MNAKAADAIIHVDTTHVATPAGRYVAISSLDSAEMTFISPRDASVKGVTAMAISPNRKYLAVGERTSGQLGRVSIVNLATMEQQPGELTFADSREVVSLAFSGDGRFLAAQTGRPDWTLLCWDWE
jgi:WD40 repeat protein